MKILRIASRATLLAVVLPLSLRAQDAAPATPAVSVTPPTPAVAPGNLDNPPQAVDVLNGPPSTQNPVQNIIDSAQPSSAPTPWYDSIFKQKLPIDFGFEVKGVHSDNIFFQAKKTEDYFLELSPSLVFTMGQPIPLAPQLDQETIDDYTNAAHLNFVQVTYRPTLRLFDKDSFLDDVDEYADGIVSHQFSRLTLSLEQTYEKLSQPTVQVNTPGTNVNRDIFTTAAKANYIYSDQLSTYSTLSQTVNSYIGDAYTDNTEWVADYYFLYQLSPKLALGLGPRIGFDDVDKAANQSFQAGLVHLNFAVTGKFTISGAGGAEVREYEHDASPELVTPILEAKAVYQPFDSMTITLDGERHRIVSNGSIGRDYTASVGELEFRQRLLQVVFVTLAAEYEDDQYTQFGGESGPARDDGIYYLKGGLEWKSFRGLTVDAGYAYLKDASNDKAFSFDESRATISATYKY